MVYTREDVKMLIAKQEQYIAQEKALGWDSSKAKTKAYKTLAELHSWFDLFDKKKGEK